MTDKEAKVAAAWNEAAADLGFGFTSPFSPGGFLHEDHA
jgi:hypothetical protein